MQELSLPIQFIVSFLIGSVIGLEREINEKKSLTSSDKPTAILGLRSFSLVAMLGTIVGILHDKYLILSILIGFAFSILLLVFYYLDSKRSNDPGITTELALLYSFITGILVAINIFPIQLTLAISVIVILLLSQKDRIKGVVEDIQKEEMNAFISYAIIALVILPFLPNTSFTIQEVPFLQNIFENFGINFEKIGDIELINPFKLWLIVALITGVDLAGYILERTIGQKKGWILASIAGGFISSTATTLSLAQQSKESKRINHLLAAALIANLVSFFQVAILIAPLNSLFLARLVPTLFIMVVAALICVFYFLKTKEGKEKQNQSQDAEEKNHEIFNLVPALRFALLYLIISFISKIALTFFGQAGFLATTALGAFVGLDAVMINTAQLAGNQINYTVAVLAFILANAVNLGGKSFYSYIQGEKSFAFKLTVSMVIIIFSSLIGLLFV